MPVGRWLKQQVLHKLVSEPTGQNHVLVVLVPNSVIKDRTVCVAKDALHLVLVAISAPLLGCFSGTEVLVKR